MKFARRRPSPFRRSSTSWIRKSTRFAIYARDGFDCVFCHLVFPLGYDGAGLTLDHIVPRDKGGSDAPENLATACHDCNSRRQHRELSRQELADVRAAIDYPLNRELGLHYARLYTTCRNLELPHPLTSRVPPKVLFHPYAQSEEMAFDDEDEELLEDAAE